MWSNPKGQKMTKFKLWLQKIGFYIYIASGLWVLKSRLWWVFTKTFDAVPLWQYIEYANRFILGMGYTSDKLTLRDGFGDIVEHPSTVYLRFLRHEPVGDCDDRALFFSYVTKRSIRTWGNLRIGNSNKNTITDVWYMVVGWNKNAHAVCLCQVSDGTYFWFDYNSIESSMFTNRKTKIMDCAYQIAENYGCTSDRMLIYSIFNPETLKEVATETYK